MSKSHTVHVIISGRVQGVWYRAWTAQTAQRLGLSGWVRNRSDGTVEAVFSGSPETIELMVSECRKGPPAARVDGIDETVVTTPVEPGFQKRATV